MLKLEQKNIKAPQKTKKLSRIRISPGTIAFIVILLSIFGVWNFYLMPRMWNVTPLSEAPQVYIEMQHNNLDVINKQLAERHPFLKSTEKPVPAATGKPNPFE